NFFKDIHNRTDLCPEEEFIQCATLKLNKGKTFRAHKHIEKSRSFARHIAQESWVVVRGSVEAYFYDLDDSFIQSVILRSGDA
ncbi:MAG TPA: hypothetical protein DCM40_23455, partial [Maribacter sp.]|nr:hypothetical protein [Maribacter sp.]